MFSPASTTDGYPSSVDLRSGCPEVYDQGQIGSCTANAIAAAFQFELGKQNLLEFMPSRLFIYFNERQVEGNARFDSGAQIRDGVKSIATLGVCHESMWPYDGTPANKDQTWPNTSSAGREPPEGCYEEALKNKALRYHRVKQDINHMKACLTQGYPYVAGFTVYQSFESDAVRQSGVVPLPQRNEKTIGGHAILVVGYDDNRAAWLVRNSWGPNWGDGGYCWMPFEYFTNPNLSSDFWTVRVVDEA
jgi:C1A family cysteine protease